MNDQGLGINKREVHELESKNRNPAQNAIEKHRVNVKELPDKINDKKGPGVRFGTLTAMD